MLMSLSLRHIVGSRSLKNQSQFRLHLISCRHCAAHTHLFLHRKNAIKIAVVIPLQQFQYNSAANAVIQRFSFHFSIAKIRKFGIKADIVSYIYIFQSIFSALVSDIHK